MHSIFIIVIVTIVRLPCKSTGYPQPPLPSTAIEDIQTSVDDPETENAESRYPENSQNFYPSYPPYQHPPLGHSRPYYHQQERAYSHRPQSAYQQQVTYDSPRYSGYKDDRFRSIANTESQGILGSGNFGVIRGGTFYDDNDNDGDKHYDKDYTSYFGNGHSGPFYFGGGNRGVPNPRPYQHEQFENFRDFADINTPSNPAYSQYVVVYANKNASREDTEQRLATKHPKNIIESLALLDLETTTIYDRQREEEREEEIDIDDTGDDGTVPQKKQSKSKAKLAKLLPEKKYKKNFNKIQRDSTEPLLALS